jgi:hypothetical protein
VVTTCQAVPGNLRGDGFLTCKTEVIRLLLPTSWKGVKVKGDPGLVTALHKLEDITGVLLEC